MRNVIDRESFIIELLKHGGHVSRASKAAGFTPLTGSKLLKDPEFRRRYKQAKERLVERTIDRLAGERAGTETGSPRLFPQVSLIVDPLPPSKDYPKRFWRGVYTIAQLAELLQIGIPEVVCMMQMGSINVPAYWLFTNLPLWHRDWIDRWIDDKAPAVAGLVEHRRACYDHEVSSRGSPPRQEYIPAAGPLVALKTGGLTAIQKEENQ